MRSVLEGDRGDEGGEVRGDGQMTEEKESLKYANYSYSRHSHKHIYSGICKFKCHIHNDNQRKLVYCGQYLTLGKTS